MQTLCKVHLEENTADPKRVQRVFKMAARRTGTRYGMRQNDSPTRIVVGLF